MIDIDPTSGGEPPLVEGALQRDPDAWEAIYRSAYPRLFSYARSRLADDGEAEDAVSETMARALQRIDAFRSEGVAVDGWLFGILRNIIFETHRKRSRPLPPAAAFEAGSPDLGAQDPLARTLAGEQAAAVHRAFALLSPNDREILELRVLGGLSSDEVAAVVGKRPGAVRMAQARALERLRDALAAVEAGDER